MTFKTKAFISVSIIAIAALIAFKEVRSACVSAAPAGDAHGHAHGASAEASSEGWGQRFCETSFVATLVGTSGKQVAANEPASGEQTQAAEKGEHKEGDGHDHGAEKKEGDGHDHGPEKKEGGDGHDHGSEGGEASEGLVKLTPEQITSTGIEMAPAVSGDLVKEIAVPGRVAINANAQARIVAKLSGTAATVRKQLGENVAKDEILATLESREMADAVADYLASWRAEELAESVFTREERLWKQKVTAEQDYLTAKNAHQSAQIKLDLAHQKLHAIGFSHDEITGLPQVKDETGYRFYEIRSPIAGRVTARDLVLGQVVGTDREIFTVADLSKVWVEMAVSPQDLGFASEGQEVRVQSGTKSATAKIIALSPVIDPETRSAKAIAELDNKDDLWKIGDYVDARLVSGKQPAEIVVPLEAIQTINGKKAVFVNESGGFRMKPITTGREDGRQAEVLSGLEFGETIATTNTFTLKAELGKSEAEHEH